VTDKDLEELKRRIEQLETNRYQAREYAAKTVKQRVIDGMIIFEGVADSRPDGTTEVKAYFATDTNVLSIWNSESEAWKTTTLT
jgi:hypothetical protein